MIRRLAIAAAAAWSFLPPSAGAEPVTNVARLLDLAREFEARLEAGRTPLYHAMRAGTDPANATLANDPALELMFLAPNGRPFYYATENENAASTTHTNLVWPGGGYGLYLTGATTTAGQLAIWDGGRVRVPHQEFGGRAVQRDTGASENYHATHVACTMIGAGVVAAAKGMSYQAAIDCYNFSNDNSEMATDATENLRISNHSYGFVAGWRESGADWYWYGDTSVSDVEDYGFGFYDEVAADWDEIAFNAPYYLICASAGNDRNDFGPGPGGEHYVFEDGSWEESTDTRDPDGGTTGYDTMPWTKTAKNVLAVGAVEDLPAGYVQPSDVQTTVFSNWGPTDDGRIKPDLVANGASLYSATTPNNNSYTTLSGTSMSSPNLSGSANLIAEQFEQSLGANLTAAGLKALLVHTASEAGPATGPDYEHGWGLLNTLAAAQLVDEHAASEDRVFERTITGADPDYLYFTLEAPAEVRITIAWTDVPGTPPAPALDPSDLALVNDLDLRVVDHVSAGTGRGDELDAHEPWILDPANPAVAATTGNNFRDNVEQVRVATLPAGNWGVLVAPKSYVVGGTQDYALISSVGLSEDPPQPVGVAELAPAFEFGVSVRPNPSVGTASISYTIDRQAAVSVDVYDVRGRNLRRLAAGDRETAGAHVLEWDGRDAAGRDVPSGVYFVRVTAGGRERAKKITLLRER